MELTYLTVCTQNTKNIIIKIFMLIRCIFEYFQKKRKVLTMNKKNGNLDKFGKREEILGNLPKIQRFKFERASFRSSGGRGVDRLLVIGSRDALVKGRPCYRESRYRESPVYMYQDLCCLNFHEINLI